MELKDQTNGMVQMAQGSSEPLTRSSIVSGLGSIVSIVDSLFRSFSQSCELRGRMVAFHHSTEFLDGSNFNCVRR